MSMLLMLKEGGSLGIDTIGNKPIDEDIDLIEFGDLKFVLFNGTQDNILGETGELTFVESDGSTDNILLTGNRLSFTLFDGTVDNIDLT